MKWNEKYIENKKTVSLEFCVFILLSLCLLFEHFTCSVLQKKIHAILMKQSLFNIKQCIYDLLLGRRVWATPYTIEITDLYKWDLFVFFFSFCKTTKFYIVSILFICQMPKSSAIWITTALAFVFIFICFNFLNCNCIFSSLNILVLQEKKKKNTANNNYDVIK